MADALETRYFRVSSKLRFGTNRRPGDLGSLTSKEVSFRLVCGVITTVSIENLYW